MALHYFKEHIIEFILPQKMGNQVFLMQMYGLTARRLLTFKIDYGKFKAVWNVVRIKSKLEFIWIQSQ